MQRPFILIVLLIKAVFGQLTYGQPVDIQQASYQHKPIVEMQINNKKTWVLLDTGSDITILDSKSKKHLGFDIVKSASRYVPGFGSENNLLHRVKNASLLFGNTALRGPMYAFDLGPIAESIQARTGKRISAIIGTSLMQAYGFVIDLGNNSVVMYNKSRD
ncbi:MAG: retropepsin-like domain-containing protein [Saprospiraceae bacterium]|nr:retropepsin-like domain-containing protein [Saprospiraceae bacterium]